MRNLPFIIIALLLSGTSVSAQMQGGHVQLIESELEYFKTDSFVERSSWEGILNAKSISVIYLELSNNDSILSLKAFVDGKERADIVEKGGVVAKYQGMSSPANLRNIPFDRSANERSFKIEYRILRRDPINSTFRDLGFKNQSESYDYNILIPSGLKLAFQIHGDTTHFESFSLDSSINSQKSTYRFQSKYPDEYFKSNTCLAHYIPGLRLGLYNSSQSYGNGPMANTLRRFFRIPNVQPDSFVSKLVRQFEQSGSEADKSVAVFRYLQKEYQNFEPGLDWPLYRPGRLSDLEHRKVLSSVDLNLLYYTVMRELGVYTMLIASNPIASAFDFNFPFECGISYFGCAINFENSWHFTDFQSGSFIPFHPNINLQEKQYLMFDSENYFFEKMPSNKPEMNLVRGSNYIVETDDGFEGISRIKYTGLSQAELSGVLFGTNPKLVKSVLENYFSGGSTKVSYSDFTHRYNGDTLIIEAKLKAGKDLFIKHKGKYYLEPSFNNFPHNLLSKADACTPENILSSYKNFNVFTTDIVFQNHIKLNQSYTLDKVAKGLNYYYTVEQPKEKSLRFRYFFRNEHLYLPKSAIPSFNQFNKELSGMMYRPMVLEY